MCRRMKEGERDSQAASLEECVWQRAVQLVRALGRESARLPHPFMMMSEIMANHKIETPEEAERRSN